VANVHEPASAGGARVRKKQLPPYTPKALITQASRTPARSAMEPHGCVRLHADPSQKKLRGGGVTLSSVHLLLLNSAERQHVRISQPHAIAVRALGF
jgi:hypothetical protein